MCRKTKLHENRNCRKYFPSAVDPGRRACWSARVSIETDKRKREIAIPDTAVSECPVSYITQDSMQIVELVQRNRISKEAGAPLFGPVANRWPAWLHDAIAVVESADAAEHKARDNARD